MFIYVSSSFRDLTLIDCKQETNSQLTREHLVGSDHFSSIYICRFSTAVTAERRLGDVFSQKP